MRASVRVGLQQQRRQSSANTSAEVPPPIPPVSHLKEAFTVFCVGRTVVCCQNITSLAVMSCTNLVFLATLLVCTTMAAAQAWTAPAFCKGLDCPKYTVVKQLGDGIELRRYEPGMHAQDHPCNSSCCRPQSLHHSFHPTGPAALATASTCFLPWSETHQKPMQLSCMAVA